MPDVNIASLAVRITERQPAAAQGTISDEPILAIKVTLVGAGFAGVEEIRRLERFLSRPYIRACDVRVIELTTSVSGSADKQSDSESRERLESRIRISNLIVFAAESDELSQRLLTGADPLLAQARWGNVVFIDLSRKQEKLEAAIRANERWAASLNISRQARWPRKGISENRLLRGAPEALLASLLGEGIVCVDYADYRNAFVDDAPLLLQTGFGVGKSGNRARAACAQAELELRGLGGFDGRVCSGWCAVTIGEDDTERNPLEEMEEATNYFCSMFEGCKAPDLFAAVPIGASFGLEVAFLTARGIK